MMIYPGMHGHIFPDSAESDVCERCELTAETIEDFAVECGQKWERRGHLLTTFATGITEQCRSENEAKKLSRKLQQSSLGLGRGEMRVIA